MAISLPAYGTLVAGGMGAAATLGMATTDKETARQIRQGTTIFGAAGATVAIGSGWIGLELSSSGDETALAKWAHGTSKITGFPRAGNALATGGAVVIGVAAANAAAEWVLDIDDNSLAGS